MLNFKTCKNLYTVAIFVIGLVSLSCKKDVIINSKNKKINGISYVASREQVDISAIKPITEVNSNYISFIPYAIGFPNNPVLKYDPVRQWWGETLNGVKQQIRDAKELNLLVMVKPQVWITDDSYIGHFGFNTNEEWEKLETSFEKYIMNFARLAEEENADMFCIGTEFGRFIKNRPQFWNNLIDSVRLAYSGELTYASNWDDYELVPFWDKVDYIGVDAYFPLSTEKTPLVEDLKLLWEPIAKNLEQFSLRNRKSIIFTEYGYCSRDFSTKEPWDPNLNTIVNLNAQKNAYQALYEVFYEKNWFKGGFLWKWFSYNNDAGGLNDHNFTPQNKPTEDLIREYFSKYN